MADVVIGELDKREICVTIDSHAFRQSDPFDLSQPVALQSGCATSLVTSTPHTALSRIALKYLPFPTIGRWSLRIGAYSDALCLSPQVANGLKMSLTPAFPKDTVEYRGCEG